MFDAGLGGGGFGGGCIGGGCIGGGCIGGGSLWAPPPVARQIAAVRIEGAGPAEEGRLDLVDGPRIVAASWPLDGKIWQRHTSSDERRRFDLAHLRLDDVTRWYTASDAQLREWDIEVRARMYPRADVHARIVALGIARTEDIRCANNDPCWQRFNQERMRLELGRLYFGVSLDLPFYHAAPGKPRGDRSYPDIDAWRRLTPRFNSDRGHVLIDNGTLDINAAAALVCGSNNEDCQRKFSQERARLEWLRIARKGWQPEQFGRHVLNDRGQVVQKSPFASLDDAAPARPQARTFTITRDQLQRPQAEPAPATTAPVPMRFTPQARTQKPPALTRFLGFKPPAPTPVPEAAQPPTDPLADPAVREQLLNVARASLEALAEWPDGELDTAMAKALEWLQSPHWDAGQRQSLVESISAIATEKARRELTPEAQAAGLTVEDLLAQQIELEAPGLLQRALCWLKELVGWDDPSCKPSMEVIDMVTAQAPAGLLPPPAEGAGPDDEDAAPRTGFAGFVERTQARIGNAATYLLIAGVVVAIGWMVTVTLLAPYVFPFFGRVFDGLFGFGGKGLDVAKDLGGKTITEGGKAVGAAGGLGGAAAIAA